MILSRCYYKSSSNYLLLNIIKFTRQIILLNLLQLSSEQLDLCDPFPLTMGCQIFTSGPSGTMQKYQVTTMNTFKMIAP